MAVAAVLACAGAFAWWLWQMATAGAQRRDDLRCQALVSVGVAVAVAFIWELAAGASAAAVLATLAVAGAVAAVAQVLTADGRDLRRSAELLDSHLRDVERIVRDAEQAGAAQAQLTRATEQTISELRRSASRRAG